MLYFLIVLAVVLVGVAVWNIWEHRQEEKQRTLVSWLRRTEMYGHVYPELKHSRERLIESITIRPEVIAIRFLAPLGETKTFSFEKLGYDPLEQETLYAMAQAISIDMALDMKAYALETHTEHLPDGTPWRWYEYCIKTWYKDELMAGLERRAEE